MGGFFEVADIVFLTLFIFFVFRNYHIATFFLLLVAPIALLREGLPVFLMGVGWTFLFSMVLFLLFSFFVVRQKYGGWLWHVPLYLWLVWFLKGIPFDISKSVLFFVIIYTLFSKHFFEIVRSRISVNLEYRIFILGFLLLFGEIFWVIGILPIGYLFGPPFLILFFYFFVNMCRYYFGNIGLKHVMYTSMFTFCLMLVTVLIVIQKPF